MNKKNALKVQDTDNVATVFETISAGTPLHVLDKKGGGFVIEVLNDIPYGHKLAIRDIKAGEPVLKYGEVIGMAPGNIKRGEHVHIHNIDSRRGRGDLEG